ncbi:class I SAM-dependent methyltransferase [Rhodococcus triatomae]|uniref:class I SAM-dependent methyltransferase n=1 Tax=Rhodococcus triatomae TaxID=300028 RepID=UPI0009328C07|nr:class I SAM-dependent methyltransferase [Rhodococcus triatomae]
MTREHADGAGRSFGEAATAYETGRPDYPQDFVDEVLPPAPSLVADVGAGTGKLTRVVRRTGRDVVAVDPDARMLERLSAASPEVRTRVGTGESLPLPDASVDAVVFGQAWHWVDPPRAAAEAARVLRASGPLVLLWNIRDLRDGFARTLAELIGDSPAETLIDGPGPVVPAPFGPLEHLTVDWVREMTTGQLLEMVASRSTLIDASVAERNRILAAVREMTGGGPVRLPYVTHAFVTRRPATGR